MSFADIAALALIAAAAAAAVVYMIRRKKSGKGCPYCCDGCPHSGKCGKK